MTDHIHSPLGAVTAESDKSMLRSAFLETSQYQQLVHDKNINFVVGRRGAGKSATFGRIQEHPPDWAMQPVVSLRDDESEYLSLKRRLRDREASFRLTRAVVRILFRSYLLDLLRSACGIPWPPLRDDFERDFKLIEKHLPSASGHGFCAFAAKCLDTFPGPIDDIPGRVARALRVETVQTNIDLICTQTGKYPLVLVDRLDEGWTPDSLSTALLGGIVKCAAKFSESEANTIRVMLFIRDNMYRALAALDPDFMRTVSGRDLRIDWSEEQLFSMATMRLRRSLNKSTESNEKVWNSFVHNSLRGRRGFTDVLRKTLLRPRDVINLLNRAHQIAGRRSASKITEEDVNNAANELSRARVYDLIREYDGVFPGLRPLVEQFRGANAIHTYEDVDDNLDITLTANRDAGPEASDFAVLDTSRQAFHALYGIGFLGVLEEDGATFRHDGADGIPAVAPATKVMVHPSYWAGLDIRTPDNLSPEIVSRVRDEYGEVPATQDIADQRFVRLGDVLQELDDIPTGMAGWREFESWCLRTTKILFSYSLSNIEHKSNEDGVSRRDVVGTNECRSPFWQRLRKEFGVHQTIFEIKNYEQLKASDYRQLSDYTGQKFGTLGFIIYRKDDSDGLTSNEKSHVTDLYARKDTLCFLLPTYLLRIFLKRYSKKQRADYVDGKMAKRLDTFLRRYTQETSA